MENKNYTGHFTAALTILIWGTTFISTKVLLEDFQPVEILVFRFILGFVILLLISPRRLKTKGKGEELLFVGAGLSGICLYYLLENIALTYTLASNVGVIISVAPFFTAILAHLFLGAASQEEKLGTPFFIGFFLAMAGIIMISFNGARTKAESFRRSSGPAGGLGVGGIFYFIRTKAESFRRSSGPAGGLGVGGIFYFIQKDQQPGVSRGTDYQEDFFLRTPVYDSGILSPGFPAEWGAPFKTGESAEYPLSGSRSLSSLLCDLEFFCKEAGGCKHQYLYLSGAGNHRGHLCSYFT